LSALVPAVNFSVQNDGEVVIPVSGGAPLVLTKRRIRTWVLVGNETMLRQAIVDTGAPYCMMTKRLWTELDRRGQINWMAFPPSTAPLASLPMTELLGGRHPFRVGRLRIRLTELAPNSPIIDAGSVLALCVENDVIADIVNSGVILGLGGMLNGRTMIVQASETGDRWSAVLLQP
jgi:hypothetical protein